MGQSEYLLNPSMEGWTCLSLIETGGMVGKGMRILDWLRTRGIND